MLLLDAKVILLFKVMFIIVLNTQWCLDSYVSELFFWCYVSFSLRNALNPVVYYYYFL